MKIITGRDYYDSALRYGLDESVVFVRNKDKSISLSELPIHRVVSIGRDEYPFCADSVQIYFCGKRYHGFRVEADDGISHPRFGGWAKFKTFWTFDTFCQYREECGYKLSPYKTEDVKKYYAESGSDKYENLLAEKGITIAVLDDRSYYGRKDDSLRWYIDGFDLRSYEFFKVKDAYTAFQEIASWVGGVLPHNNLPPDVTDDLVKAQKHGYDKFSFRKAPTKASKKKPVRR